MYPVTCPVLYDVTRFEETITGQFHGHTHYDHFALHYDPENSTRATGMGFISPR